jgi:hypothetical protein
MKPLAKVHFLGQHSSSQIFGRGSLPRPTQHYKIADRSELSSQRALG